MSRAQLDLADILCSGHFGQTCKGTSTVELTIDSYTDSGVEKKIFPFRVDHYWKGSGPAELDVARFSGSSFGDLFAQYDYKPGETLLLALKKDVTGSQDYQLVDITRSWLLVPDHSLDNLRAAGPDQIVENAVADALQSGSKYGWSMLDQALLTSGTFQTNTPEALAAIKKVLTNPDLQSRHGEAIEALFKIDPRVGCRMCFSLCDAGFLNSSDRYDLGRQLYSAVTAETLSQIDPAELQKMANIPETEVEVCEAFVIMSQHGAPASIPWLGLLLSSPDPEVQDYAMEGLDNFNGGRRAGFNRPQDTGNLNHHWGAFPENVIAPYKAWVATWMVSHPQYAIPGVKH